MNLICFFFGHVWDLAYFDSAGPVEECGRCGGRGPGAGATAAEVGRRLRWLLRCKITGQDPDEIPFER